MIPVALQPEPVDFDAEVRQRGMAWLALKGIAPGGAAPKGTKFSTYWSYSNKQLWSAYSGVCAYLAIYFEWPSGAASTDHFVPKSLRPDLAYEWSNFRLSCLAPNRLKNKYNDVIDPMVLAANTFELNLVTGEIRPNSSLQPTQIQAATKTIKRLKLDSPEHNHMRQRHYNQYLRHKDAQTLRELSPFVWHEADRQGLL
jgi:uncharacterized protein (TIGR02646 family)